MYKYCIITIYIMFMLAGDEKVGQLLLHLDPGHAVFLSDRKVCSKTLG